MERSEASGPTPGPAMEGSVSVANGKAAVAPKQPLKEAAAAFETAAATEAPASLHGGQVPQCHPATGSPAGDAASTEPAASGSAGHSSQQDAANSRSVAADSSSSLPKSTGPASAANSGPSFTPLQWLRQTYEQQWKGAVTISTVAADDHAPKRPHWLCSIAATGAVVKDKSGKNVSLDPIIVETEARSKKEAEQSAAQQIHDMMVEQGCYDPNKPTASKKGKVGRATKFITDNIASNEANPLAYLDISIDGVTAGRVVVELFRYKAGTTQEEHAPLAVDNFLALCRGVDIAGQHRSYAGVPFTTMVPRTFLQTGDVVNKDGTGRAQIHSTYGEYFPDEGLDDKSYRHNRPFMLSVANMCIEDTNSSQFFITLAPIHELDGRHTCFGKVLAGYGVLKQVEALAAAAGPDRPPNTVFIQSCGELPAGHDYKATVVLSGGGWPLYPEDQGPPPEGVREAQFRLDIAAQLKEAGNAAYKQGDAAYALARYEQAFRYLNWTTFKIRTAEGEADLERQESNALWNTEVLLMGNIAAAELKLGRYKAATDTCQELLHRAPYSVKGLLRAGQAAIGIADYSTAARHLKAALDQAKQQQLPTREILAELHRLRDLQQQQRTKQKARFSAAFAKGVLHHPSDDQPSSSLNSGSNSVGSSTWMFSEGMQHRVADQLLGRRALGPVSRERVLDSDQPVLVDDAWGTHPLVAEPDSDDDSHGFGIQSHLDRSAGLGLGGSWHGPVNVASPYSGSEQSEDEMAADFGAVESSDVPDGVQEDAAYSSQQQ